MATSVEKLALSMQSMLKEQEKQGKRLEVLEGRDGENGARYKEIKTLNGLKNNTIHAGQVLKLPN